MEERFNEYLNNKNPEDQFSIKIDFEERPVIFISYRSKEDILESRGDLLNSLPTKCFLPDLSEFISSYPEDQLIYVCSSKNENVFSINVGFDKRYFGNINIDESYFYKTTLKQLVYFIISSKLKKLESFEKTIICHCQYHGITNSDAAKLLGINLSDFEMLSCGKIEKIKNLNQKDVLNTLGIPSEENSDSYFSHLLEKIEFKEIINVFE